MLDYSLAKVIIMSIIHNTQKKNLRKKDADLRTKVGVSLEEVNKLKKLIIKKPEIVWKYLEKKEKLQDQK